MIRLSVASAKRITTGLFEAITALIDHHSDIFEELRAVAYNEEMDDESQ